MTIHIYASVRLRLSDRMPPLRSLSIPTYPIFSVTRHLNFKALPLFSQFFLAGMAGPAYMGVAVEVDSQMIHTSYDVEVHLALRGSRGLRCAYVSIT